MLNKVDPMYWDYHCLTDIPVQPKFYKITTSDGMGLEGIIYEQGTVYASSEKVEKIFSGTSVHAYTDPILAMLIQPAFEGYPDPVVWEAEMSPKLAAIEGVVAGNEIHIIKKMHINLGTINRVRTGFGFVRQVYKDNNYLLWILDWFNRRQGEFTPDDIVRISGKEADREFDKKTKTDKHEIFCPSGFAAMAANYMGQAAQILDQSDDRQIKIELVHFLIAQAILYSIYAAHQKNNPIKSTDILERSFRAEVKIKNTQLELYPE